MPLLRNSQDTAISSKIISYLYARIGNYNEYIIVKTAIRLSYEFMAA